MSTQNNEALQIPVLESPTPPTTVCENMKLSSNTVHVFSSRNSASKTSFLISLACDLVRQGNSLNFLSEEVEEKPTFEKAIANLGHIKYGDILNPVGLDHDLLDNTIIKYGQLFGIKNKGQEFREILTVVKASYQIGIKYFIIDNLQNIKIKEIESPTQNLNVMVASLLKISQRLKITFFVSTNSLKSDNIPDSFKQAQYWNLTQAGISAEDKDISIKEIKPHMLQNVHSLEAYTLGASFDFQQFKLKGT